MNVAGLKSRYLNSPLTNRRWGKRSAYARERGREREIVVGGERYLC